MIASGQNLKRLLAFGPGGPRKMAMVAALRPPEKPYPHHPPRPHRTTTHGVFQHAGKFCELRHYEDLGSLLLVRKKVRNKAARARGIHWRFIGNC